MQIRPGTYADAVAGSALLRSSIEQLCHPDHLGDPAEMAAWTANKTPQMWNAWIEQATTELFVAVENERLVGVGMCTQSGEVLLNYVAPDARWRGVSKALLAHMESALFASGVTQCRLKSTTTAHAFYEAAGYRLTDTEAGDVYMAKSLGDGS